MYTDLITVDARSLWRDQTAHLRQHFIRWQGRAVTVLGHPAGSGRRTRTAQTGWVAWTTAQGWGFTWRAIGSWGATRPTDITTFFMWQDLWASDGRVMVGDPFAESILTDDIAQTVSAWVAETAMLLGLGHVKLPDLMAALGGPEPAAEEEQEVSSDGNNRLSASPDRNGSRGLNRPARRAQAARDTVGGVVSVSR